MSRTRWISAAAAALLLISAAPAQAAPDRSKLRPAGFKLTAAAGAAASAKSRTAAPAAQSPVTLSQACDPATVALKQTTTCTITAENTGAAAVTADLGSVTTPNLPITAATGATATTPFTAKAPRATLAGVRPAGPSTVAPDPGKLFGYLPLTAFGVEPNALGDEEIRNLDVPGFAFNDTTYSKIGITSNGYLVAGGGEPADVSPDGTLPDATLPNNVIAPFWTDLDGTGAPGVLATVLTDGVSNWIVVEWQVNVRGTANQKVFQVWLGVNGVQDIQYAYRFDTIADPGQPLTVGAENAGGTAGVRLPAGTLPTTDLRVTSTGAQPGGKASYTLTLKGLIRGPGQVLTAGKVAGTTVPLTVTTPVTVTR